MACLRRLEGVAGGVVMGAAGRLPPSLRVLAKMIGRKDRVGKAARRLVRRWRREVAEGKEGTVEEVVDVDEEHNVRVRKVSIEKREKEKTNEQLANLVANDKKSDGSWKKVMEREKSSTIRKILDELENVDEDDEEETGLPQVTLAEMVDDLDIGEDATEGDEN